MAMVRRQGKSYSEHLRARVSAAIDGGAIRGIGFSGQRVLYLQGADPAAADRVGEHHWRRGHRPHKLTRGRPSCGPHCDPSTVSVDCMNVSEPPFTETELDPENETVG